VCEPDLLGNTLTERLDGKISFAIYEKASQSTRERNYGLGEKQPRLRTTCEAQTYGLRLLLPKNRVNEVRRFENRKRSFTGLCVMCIPCAPAIKPPRFVCFFLKLFLSNKEKVYEKTKFRILLP